VVQIYLILCFFQWFV